jgi:succinate-semialdehyde dehydrogenase/glutarate-semialdehyde dehydrogenase
MEMRIGGAESPGISGTRITVVNPSTGAAIDSVPGGVPEDVGAAVHAAREALPGWSSFTMRDRGKILLAAASRVRDRHKEIARLLVTEQGKPLVEAVDEIRGFCNTLEFYGCISGIPSGDVVNLGSPGDCMVVREPIGVCGAIIPWNVPAILMGWKCGPSLLAGNTLVLKPASDAPLTVLTLARELEGAGLPPGVLNVVTGEGGVVGEAMVRDPSIQKISFTGDTVTGKRVREAAGGQLKEITLELGGSDPMIIWKDADIGKAVAGAFRGRFYNCGQTCTAVKRLFVHESVFNQVTDALAAAVERMKVADGLSEGCDMGPLVSKGQRERLEDQLGRALATGEPRVVAQGSVPDSPAFTGGSFFPPVIVSGIPQESPLMKEEVFGPVLPVASFSDLDEAIRLANNTRFGLGASVWTRDLQIARQVMTRVQAGIVWVNRHLTVPPEVPFGGIKESGLGRENGIQAINAWSRQKSIFMSW